MPKLNSDPFFDQRWPHFISLLAAEVAMAGEAHPTVRVWKDTELITLISSVIHQHRPMLKFTFPPAREVVERLIKSRWLRPISVEENHTGRSFYLMDLEAPEGAFIDVEELLLATQPAGVLSYFTALRMYDLTTQMPPFAHVGVLVEGCPPETQAPAPDKQETLSAKPARNPLGTLLFHYEGQPCYRTNRYTGLTPGVTMRTQSERTRYRVTTLEQTLLDTLLQPERCGGEEVVFEAWERGVEKDLDWDRLEEYLLRIGRESLIRRTGAMLELSQADVPADSPLHALLQSQRSAGGRHEPPLPLLPGLKYSQMHEDWNLLIP